MIFCLVLYTGDTYFSSGSYDNYICPRGRRDRERMVVGFTITYVIIVYHHWNLSMTGLWFSAGTPVSSTNKTDNHDKTEVLLKVVLNS